jgi:hypothetical protein
MNGRAVQRAVQSNAVDIGTTDVTLTVFNVPGLASGTYFTHRHELRATVTFAQSFLAQPDAWGRSVGSAGWSAVNPHEQTNEGDAWAGVVDGTVSATGMQVRTYVFEVFNAQGQFLGWFPTTVAGARLAWTAIGPVSQLPDVANSFFVPQTGAVASPTEGASAIQMFRACPNNDGGASLPNNARIKVLLKNASGAPIVGVAAADINILLNGGTPAQGFSGAGADSIIANGTYNLSPLCPDVRMIPADAATDVNGVTYITFAGATPGSPGVATRDPNRKWGHYDAELPVYALGVKLSGRITSGGSNGTYVLRIKNFDHTLGDAGGLGTTLNKGELVNTLDYNSVVNNLNVNDQFSYWRDFDSSGTVNSIDLNMLNTHLNHSCSVPNSP